MTPLVSRPPKSTLSLELAAGTWTELAELTRDFGLSSTQLIEILVEHAADSGWTPTPRELDAAIALLAAGPIRSSSASLRAEALDALRSVADRAGVGRRVIVTALVRLAVDNTPPTGGRATRLRTMLDRIIVSDVNPTAATLPPSSQLALFAERAAPPMSAHEGRCTRARRRQGGRDDG